MFNSSNTNLTDAQNELYEWIKNYMRDFHHSPSIRQMMEAMGLKSPAPIQSRLKHLQQKGFIKLGKFLAVVFALLCVGASFGGGNAAQSNQAAMQLVSSFGMTGGNARTIIGLIMMFIVGIIIIGGIAANIKTALIT